MKLLIASMTLWMASAAAQNLTPAQKEADFRYLASLYATYYAPLTWKNQLFNFNPLNLTPWLQKVSATETDLDFYEVCVEYISNLNDSHVSFILPSDFGASLGFGVDLYDGVPLIDTLNRARLPLAQYPFVIGDELISIDGVDALTLADSLKKYTPQGNPRAALRSAAQRLTTRAQSRFPHAPDVGESAVVVIKRQNGDTEQYTIPWIKTGTPIEVGPVPSPKLTAQVRAAARQVDPLHELQFSGVLPDEQKAVNGYGARNPIFLAGLPSTFTRRLGAVATDFFYSGVFQTGEFSIGYIRIPNYAPPSQPLAFSQLETEIVFMNANTDGLVIDEMRNTGGNLCFGEEVARRLTPYEFQATGFELRAFWTRTLGFYNAMINAIANGAPQQTIDQYELLYKEMLAATREGKVATSPLPLCTSSLMRQPIIIPDGRMIAYQKPIMVLIDDFSTSTADSFAAMMQDSGRALLYGMRSNGAGGNNTAFDAGVFSEAAVGMTLALQSRKQLVAPDDFPSSHYIENVGVRPHVENDYMTRQNLLGSGAAFISQFLDGMAAYIRQQRQ